MQNGGCTTQSLWPPVVTSMALGHEHRESQPLAEHQEVLPGFGRSLRSVYGKEPVKLNGMMAPPSLIMCVRQGVVPATC